LSVKAFPAGQYDDVVPELVTSTRLGLHCAAGGFYLDPSGEVEQAVLTHAHSDHARPGSRSYLCADASLPFLRKRLGPDAPLRGLAYGERLRLGDVVVSFHPAGHVRGSAQVRLESDDEVWVVSGDYKRAPDPTCPPFEVVPCDVFVTESTFGLPIYRWEEPATVAADILEWWDANRAAGVASVLFCYAMGKAQRLLAELARLTDRPALAHGAVQAITELFRMEAGPPLLATDAVAEQPERRSYAGELILAPLSASGSVWMRRFGAHETALASGLMRVRGTRRRKGYDRGFPLSDHADWPALLRTVEETGARRVRVTHGWAEELARYLAERGHDTAVLPTGYEGEADI
jgi:putative mRNA 3-end processing factor